MIPLLLVVNRKWIPMNALRALVKGLDERGFEVMLLVTAREEAPEVQVFNLTDVSTVSVEEIKRICMEVAEMENKYGRFA